MSHNLCAIAVTALIYCSLLYWLPRLSGWRAITLSSYHGGFLDGAKTVDENVHSVLHRSSWIWKEEMRPCGINCTFDGISRIAAQYSTVQHSWLLGFFLELLIIFPLAPTFTKKKRKKSMLHTKLVKICLSAAGNERQFSLFHAFAWSNKILNYAGCSFWFK